MLKFLYKKKYAIIWTICYIAVMWLILKFMFNFDMFSVVQWHILLHAELRGFAGFVFGILILAAIPLYIATTAIILRTEKPLFTISLPKFMTPVPEEKPKESSSKEPDSTDKKPDDAPQKPIPTEMKAAFLRARTHMGPAPKSNFDIGNMVSAKSEDATEAKTLELQPAESLPIPQDFDISEPSAVPSFTPMFTELDFDAEPEHDSEYKDASQTIYTKATTDDKITSVINYLTERGKKCEIENDIILTDDQAIAIHCDDDFWIADDDVWFATGLQKPSPVASVISIAQERGLNPILYLGSTNIMDLETNKSKWESLGVKVVTTLSDL